MKNIIILSKNYENYRSGYYHQDLIGSFNKVANCYLYGEGYPNYSNQDKIDDVIAKSPFKKSSIDLIVASTSWEIQNPIIKESDPHPRINLSDIKNIPKTFFLNKEYKKLNQKLEYAKRNKFDYVVTVHPDYKKWGQEAEIKFIHLPFGISLERFRDFGLKEIYDFAFTGNLHRKHIDIRYLVKQEIFKKKYLHLPSNKGRTVFFKRNPIKYKYQKYNIYWAEWGAKNIIGRSLLPTGEKYAKFLNSCKVFLNTPSAVGILNTRFFELMATRTLILCPESDFYFDILQNENNCLMFKPDLSNFEEIFRKAIDDNNLRHDIVTFALEDVKKHSYDKRVEQLFNKMGMFP